MMSVKLFAVYAFAGAIASFSVVALAQTPAGVSAQINNLTLTIQTPTLSGTSGIVYRQNGAQPATLGLNTDGFLFCANVSEGYIYQIPVQLAPTHEDQTFNPAHLWTFPVALDVQSAAYTGGSLRVNHGVAGALLTTLACHGTDADGAVPSGLTDGIFDNGVESDTASNYSHLVNWVPPSGFDWNAPDWSLVQPDPCVSSTAFPSRVIEDKGCAAVSGVRPGAIDPTRAGTIWTKAGVSTFTYLFRVDARYGAQAPQVTQGPSLLRLPTAANMDAVASSTAQTIALRDAYDAAYLNPTGKYCFLTALPPATTGLDSTVCDNATQYQLNGVLSYYFSISPPPVGNGVASFYVAVVRDIGQSSHTNTTTPVVGAAILIDPAVVAEGGDKFSGDDVVFGFMSGTPAAGFSWMKEP